MGRGADGFVLGGREGGFEDLRGKKGGVFRKKRRLWRGGRGGLGICFSRKQGKEKREAWYG